MNQAFQYIFARELICKEADRKKLPFMIMRGICMYVGIVASLVAITSLILMLLLASSMWGTIFGVSAYVFALSLIIDGLADKVKARLQESLDKQLMLLPNLLQQNYTLDDLRKEEAMKIFFPDPPKEKKKK